jgi:hypothetical protein
VNILAIDGLKIDNIRLILQKAVQIVLESVSVDDFGIVSEVYRFVECFFPIISSCDSKETRFVSEYFMGLLGSVGDNRYKDFFVAAVTIMGCISSDFVDGIPSNCPEFIEQFVLQNVRRLRAEGIVDRFDVLTRLWRDFSEQRLDDIEVSPVAVGAAGRKRTRKSAGRRKVSRTVKRRRITDSGSSADEYTSGGESTDDSFETCYEA